MNKQVIITKKAGFDIPRGYLQVVLKECPTYYGLITQDKTEDGPVLENVAEKRTIAVDDLVKTLDELKDIPVLLMFGSMHHDFNADDDMQPFVFQQVNDKVEGGVENILGVAIEGDLPNYAKPGEGHTEEYNFWDSCICPTLQEKFAASSDLPDFFNRIRASNFKQNVENPMGHRGVAVFMPLEGEIIAFGRNELGAEYDWGTTSNTFGWGTQNKLAEAAEAAVATVKKAGGRLGKLMGSSAVATNVTPAAPAQPEAPKESHKTDGNGIHHIEGKDDIWAAWPGTSSKTHTMHAIPISLQGNARNSYIRLFLGLSPNADLPKGKDKKDFKIPVANELIGFAQEQVSTKDDVRNLSSRIKAFQTPASNDTGGEQKVAPSVKPTAAPPPAEKREEPSQRPAADFLPELSAKDKLGAVSLVTEWATNPKAPTAVEIQKIEARYPPFSKTMGIKFENMANWTIAEVKLLGKAHSDALALAFLEMRRRCYELGAFEKEVNTEHVNDQDPRKGGKPAGEQVNVPPAQPQPSSSQPKTGRLARLTGKAA